MLPSSAHYDSWHDDINADEGRILGMSVNLSPVRFAGGAFELRGRESKNMVYRHENTGPGDALIFRLSPRLQHRVTDVVGDVPKTAFAGWFRSEPDDYRVLLADSVDGE